MFNVVITSGGFDPIHEGHIEYLEMAKNVVPNAYHICIVNNDNFLKEKKGYAFHEFSQRIKIVKALRAVDEVFPSIDDDLTVCDSIEHIARKYLLDPCFIGEVYFAKGGDRFAEEIPEAKVCRDYGIKIIDGLGAKIQSSSALIRTARSMGKIAKEADAK